VDRVTVARGDLARRKQWSEAVAVGRRSFVKEVQQALGGCVRYRRVEEVDGLSVLREGLVPYSLMWGSESTG
jgi:hypothetical protein